MRQPSGKLFVPDQAIYWLDVSRIKSPPRQESEPSDKHAWLAPQNLPEFIEAPKQSQQSPWRRIEGTKARNDFLKNLGPTGDANKRRLLCFTASAGVGKSIALHQIAYLRSLDPEHFVIRYHFSELPLDSEHFLLVGESKGMIGDSTRLCLVDALMQSMHGPKYRSPGFQTLTTPQESACLEFIKRRIQNGQVTLIVDGLDELTDKKEGVSKVTALQKLLFNSQFANLHCVIAGRPYAIHQDYKRVLFDNEGNSAWEFCLAATFNESQNKRYLGARYNLLKELRGQMQLTPRHLEVLRGLSTARFSKLHSIACVYFEVMQESLRGDVSREDSVGLLQQLDVKLTEDQYIGFLAALASVTADFSKDQLTVELKTIQRELHRRVRSLTNWEGISLDEFSDKLSVIRSLNHRSIEFSYFRRNDDFIVWKDRTVMDFFSALWLVRYSTQEQREKTCAQVPRLGTKGQLDENRRDLWTFLVGMPADAFEKFDEFTFSDARWKELVKRLLRPFSDAKRPTQLMYIAWQELERRIKDQNLVNSAKEVMDSFTQQFEELVTQGNEYSKIIEEDLVFVEIQPLSDGSWSVAVGHPQEPNNKPRVREGLLGPCLASKYPITCRLYKLFDRQHEEQYQSDCENHSPEPRCPVIRVNWYDAQMFSKWSKSRLLTEWEWEYACRGNRDAESHRKLAHWQSDPKNAAERVKVAWINSNSQDRTWPVDSKQAGLHTKDFGLVVMLGNVWEWTESIYRAGTVSRVLRCGSFHSIGRNASASFRIRNVPTYSDFSDGFRVARAP